MSDDQCIMACDSLGNLWIHSCPPTFTCSREAIERMVQARNELRNRLIRAEGLLSRIYEDLPTKRDWLNPDYEREMKSISEKENP